MTYIKLHPEEWNQGDWACDTAGCLAGTAVMLERECEWREVARLGNNVEYIAGDILGLTNDQACRIFYFCDVPEDDGNGYRPPTYDEFEAHVSKVTGVKFKDGGE